jgi:NAD(P)H-flavin reductase
MSELLVAPPLSTSTDPMLPAPYRVVENYQETADVCTLRVEPADGRPCLRFEPAQFGMVGIPGLGEVPISYSSDPDVADSVTCTIRAAGAITDALTASEPGDIVSMRGPYGVPWPIHRSVDMHLLVIAGGLGMAPLRSLMVVAARMSARLASISLIYGAREPSEFLFKKDIKAWEDDSGVNALLTVDHPTEQWDKNVGVVTTLFDETIDQPWETVAMMCGPDVMLGAGSIALGRVGVPAHQIWVTMERNMKCAIGLCGHCQFGGLFLCKDGPVFRYDRIARMFAVPEV